MIIILFKDRIIILVIYSVYFYSNFCIRLCSIRIEQLLSRLVNDCSISLIGIPQPIGIISRIEKVKMQARFNAAKRKFAELVTRCPFLFGIRQEHIFFRSSWCDSGAHEYILRERKDILIGMEKYDV